MRPVAKRHLIYLGITFVCLAGIAIPLLISDDLLRQGLFQLKHGLHTAEEIRAALLAYGPLTPLLFMGVQIGQVLIAPLPGEASGFLGGYLFGAWPGFIYSSIGLTIGSWIAFGLGRLLWDFMPERMLNSRTYQRFNTMVNKGESSIPFILFLIPGIPKDALSYILGVSRMPLGLFLFITAIGRMPGTLMLSLQGADVQAANYPRLILLMLISLAITLPFYYYRKKLLNLLLHGRKPKANE